MGKMEERLQQCLRCVRKKTDFVPSVGLVLGSGLGGLAEHVDVIETMDYREIDGFPVSTVPGHAGRFVFCKIGNTPVVIMQGRVHYYEGYTMEDVVLPIRLMILLGIKKLMLTNAAGGMGEGFSCGDFMLITDQIASFVPNPLIGANEDSFGPRFPDMSRIYSMELCETIRSCAGKLQIPLQEGVYIQLTGPSYETPAEIRMCKALGADAVGMSTAVEAIAARHMGVEVCGISFISNLAAGIQKVPLCHEEVKAAADQAAPAFERLVKEVIAVM